MVGVTPDAGEDGVRGPPPGPTWAGRVFQSHRLQQHLHFISREEKCSSRFQQFVFFHPRRD